MSETLMDARDARDSESYPTSGMLKWLCPIERFELELMDNYPPMEAELSLS